MLNDLLIANPIFLRVQIAIQVKSISITARNILVAAGALAMALLLLGFVLNWVGLRVAVEYNPDLARSLGGVTTEAEQLRMESVYRQNLRQIQSSMDQTVQDVKKLEALKNRFMNLATPAGLKDKAPALQNAKGGPFVLPNLTQNWMGQIFKQPLQAELQQTAEHVHSVNQLLVLQKQDWQHHLNCGVDPRIHRHPFVLRVYKRWLRPSFYLCRPDDDSCDRGVILYSEQCPNPS